MKRYVVYAILALLFIFTIQNYPAVEIRFLIWRLEMSASILIFLVLIAGFLVGYLIRHRGRAE